MAAFWKLVALVAFVLMPFGMTAAPAAAHAGPAMVSGHCDDQPTPAQHDRQGTGDCSMCSALPAMETPFAVPGEPPAAMIASPLVPGVHGIVPEIVPPPPKLS